MSVGDAVFTPGVSFHLPDLARGSEQRGLCARAHPALDRIRADSNAWTSARLGDLVGDADALARFLRDDYALWTALVLPTGIAARVTDISDWTQYFFVYDNVVSGAGRLARDDEGAGGLAAALTRVMAGGHAPAGDPLLTAFEEIWHRIARGMHDGQRERFVRSVVSFVTGCRREVAARRRGEPLDYDAYMAMRRDSVGGKTYFVLAEYALGIDLTDALPGALPGDGPLGDLTRVTLDQLILANDVLSFRAECVTDDFMNAPSVFVRHEGLDLQEAVNRVCRTVEAVEEDFLARRAAILAGPLGRHPEVRAYAEALGLMMAGNLRWSYVTSRYHGADHVWDGTTSGMLTLHQDRTSFGD